MNKERINIVWFKRDLRLMDHNPLLKACESKLLMSISPLVLKIFKLMSTVLEFE